MDRLIEQKRAQVQASARDSASKQLHSEGIATRRTETLKTGRAKSIAETHELAKLEAAWRKGVQELTRHQTGFVLAPWDPKAKSNMARILGNYGPEVTEKILRYTTANWAEINARILKGKAALPTVALICGIHETLAAEAQRWTSTSAIDDEVNRWYEAHPNEDMPAELAQRVLAAKGMS